MKKKIYGFRRGLIVLCLLMGVAQLTSAQVGVGTNTPDPSAQMHIESENKGLLIPRVTSVSLINEPAEGLMVYQTGDTSGFYYNKGTSVSPEWKRVADAGSSAAVAEGAITNANVATNAAISYSKLNLAGSIKGSDIGFGEVGGANIGNGAITSTHLGIGAINSMNIGMGTVQGSNIAMGAINSTHLAPGSISGMQLMPSSVSGMNIMPSTITGTNIMPSTITGTNIMSNTITGFNIMTAAITGDLIATGAVSPSKIDATSASNGQVLSFNGTTVDWATPTAIPTGAAGGDMTGTFPNPTIANQSVTTAKILDGTIVNSDVSTTAAIAYSKLNLAGSIVSSDITDGAVTSAKINGNGAIDGQVIGYSSTTGVGWVTPSAGSASVSSGYAANTSGSSIAVVLGGTDVPLPNAQVFSSGISVNGSNTTFTFTNAGRYMVTYNLSTTANLLMSSRLVMNGSTLSGSVVQPSVSINNFSRTVIANVSAGSVMSLNLFGIIATAVLAGDASVSIVRLQ